jgi:hypothetical protein
MQRATLSSSGMGEHSLVEETRQLCAREDLQPHYRKSPCKPEDATLEQMADKSRITAGEKEALSKVKSEGNTIAKRVTEYFRQSDPRNGNSIALLRERGVAELDKVTMDFYEGRINRGEYNKKRRDIAQQLTEQVRVASAN